MEGRKGRVKKLGSRFSAVGRWRTRFVRSFVRSGFGQLNFHFVCALCGCGMHENGERGGQDENWPRMTLHWGKREGRTWSERLREREREDMGHRIIKGERTNEERTYNC